MAKQISIGELQKMLAAHPLLVGALAHAHIAIDPERAVVSLSWSPEHTVYRKAMAKHEAVINKLCKEFDLNVCFCTAVPDPKARAAMGARLNDENELICPSCGAPNLHQNTVGVYNRDEDAHLGQRVIVEVEGGVTIDKRVSQGNPSPRRHGVGIQFSCEHCPASPRLKIYQHKGATYLEWDTLEIGQ